MPAESQRGTDGALVAEAPRLIARQRRHRAGEPLQRLIPVTTVAGAVIRAIAAGESRMVTMPSRAGTDCQNATVRLATGPHSRTTHVIGP
jgi:hypothetical protein